MTQNTETDLVVIENQAVIQTYGNRDDVREIMKRLMMLHPAAKEVKETGMLAVAQLAVMAGANPLPGAGEIYVWVDNRGNIVVFLGVAYYRRIASQKDSVMWTFMDKLKGQPRPMTQAERDYYGIPDGDLAAICSGMKLSEYEKLMDRNMPWEVAQQMLHRTSYAAVHHEEMFYQRDTRYHKKGEPVDPPHGRTWQWVAEKRAEIGIYRTLALVDTTLTDNLQAQTNQVLETVSADARSGAPLQLDTVTISAGGPDEDTTIQGFTAAELDDMFSYG